MLLVFLCMRVGVGDSYEKKNSAPVNPCPVTAPVDAPPVTNPIEPPDTMPVEPPDTIPVEPPLTTPTKRYNCRVICENIH